VTTAFSKIREMLHAISLENIRLMPIPYNLTFGNRWSAAAFLQLIAANSAAFASALLPASPSPAAPKVEQSR